jgi:hypothetical protein
MSRILTSFFVLCALSACTSPDETWFHRLDESRQRQECCVHHVGLRKENVPTAYGFGNSIVSKASRRARLYDFPFGERTAFLGCVVLENDPSRAEIVYCPACVAAREAWIIAHPDDPWAQSEVGGNKKPNQPPQTTTGSSAPTRV